MILVGCTNQNEGIIPFHFDDDDYITALLSIGDTDVNGGDTFYIGNKADDCLSIFKKVSYCRGNLQIGSYDKIMHGTSSWSGGFRGVINFSLQKKILNHFVDHGSKYYDQYINAGYPSGDFLAK